MPSPTTINCLDGVYNYYKKPSKCFPSCTKSKCCDYWDKITLKTPDKPQAQQDLQQDCLCWTPVHFNAEELQLKQQIMSNQNISPLDRLTTYRQQDRSSP